MVDEFRITDIVEVATEVADDDRFEGVDRSDLTDGAAGTSKQFTAGLIAAYVAAHDDVADAIELEIGASITAHEGAANPHPTYLTAAEADAVYEEIGAASALEATLGTAALTDSTDYAPAVHDHDADYQPLDPVLTATTASFTTADETKLDALTGFDPSAADFVIGSRIFAR